ncbi:MAG: DUF2141 domain-containing protein [Prolixibacteraceae bacterium]|nr:DUF2141 domain-containing protein [Prolixibacteraceae bacterium]
MYKRLKILLVLSLLIEFQLPAQNINIVIEGLRNKQGQVILNFYSNSKTFDKEEPEHTFVYPKSPGTNGKMIIDNLQLPTGTYGIALIDDENSNGKLDFRLMIPREGFAFSNHPFTKHRKPDFEAFSFEHSNNSYVHFEVYYFGSE